MSPWQSLISLEQIIELHAQAIGQAGQPPVVIGRIVGECVEGRLGNAWTMEAYSLEETGAKPGLCFAGYLLFYLVRDHCFSDGNKRIGLIAALSVLAALGLTINATEDEMFDVVERVSDWTKEPAIRSGLEVVHWLAARLESPD